MRADIVKAIVSQHVWCHRGYYADKEDSHARADEPDA
jgi:hypothetical protein